LIYLILALHLFSTPHRVIDEKLLGTVYLDATGKVLTSESEIILRDIADTLFSGLNLMINVYGYAHTAGSSFANISLSQQIADYVKDYLTVNLQVATDRIQTPRLDSRNPIVSNLGEKDKTKIPKAEIFVRKPDAVLTWFENDVKVQPPALRPTWLEPSPNYYLYHGYKVTTGKKSRAHIFYPNNGTLKIDEEAMVIIHSLNLQQKQKSIVNNIEAQGGGLKAILEDAVSQDDSITVSMAAAGESNLKNSEIFIGEKLKDLIVAYNSNTNVSTSSAKPVIDNDQSMILSQDTSAGIPTDFGIGVIIGEPTGLNLKKWITGQHAIDFEIGWSFPGERIHVAVNYLSHFPNWIRKHGLYPYLGIGCRLKVKTEQEEGQFKFGIRFGVGIEYICGHFGFYGESYPVVDMIPETKSSLEGGIGARYYFKD